MTLLQTKDLGKVLGMGLLVCQMAYGEHRFWDKTNIGLHTGHAVVSFGDTSLTCGVLAKGGAERWLPTQRCAGVAAILMGRVAITVGGSYFAHRRGWHRVERVLPVLGITGSTAGIVYTKTHFRESWQQARDDSRRWTGR